jgi:cytidylate kinase
MRTYATERGLWCATNEEHHNANVYSDDFDREVDFGMREKLSSERQWIIESWLSGFMAQGVPKVLKILMTCSSDDVRIDRVMNRDGISVTQAKKNTLERYETNLDKWRRMYSEQWQEWLVKPGRVGADEAIDFWREDIYDLVLDTYSLTPAQSLERVLQTLRSK